MLPTYKRTARPRLRPAVYTTPGALALALGLGALVSASLPAQEVVIPAPKDRRIVPLIQSPKPERGGRNSNAADLLERAESESDALMPPPVVRPFPVAEVRDWFADFDRQMEILSRSEEPGFDGVLLGRLRAGLRTILPPGRYRFERDCPLHSVPQAVVNDAASVEFVRLEISCLPEHHRHNFGVRLYKSGNALSGRPFRSFGLLNTLANERDFLGELTLARADLGRGFVPVWRWRADDALKYANPLLDLLRVRYPAESEAQLLAPATLAANTASLLGRFAVLSADSAYRAWRSPARDFGVIYRPGDWVRFGRSCPLEVLGPLRREPGTDFQRLELRISCLHEAPDLRTVALRIPPGPGIESDDRARDSLDWRRLPVGSRVHGLMKFSGLYTENTPVGLQFSLVWDTIKEIRLDQPLVPDP